MPPSLQLREATEKLNDRDAKLAKVYEEAKTKDADGNGIYDFRLVKCLDIGNVNDEARGSAVGEKVAAMILELNECSDEVTKFQTIENGLKAREDLNRAKPGMRHPSGEESPEGAPQKAISELLTEHPKFKAWQAGNEKASSIDLPDFDVKTLFQTSAGWAPESIRLPGFVPKAFQPAVYIDHLPTNPTGMAAIKYMEETTRTPNAAETAEGGAYPEATFAHTERSKNVLKITTNIPITDEQLEDVDGAQAYIEANLRAGIRERLSSQSINGDRTANPEEIDGLLLVSGIQTHAKGTDPVMDAIHRAMTKVEVVGRAVANLIVLHPNDWQDIRLDRTADGIYILGGPGEDVAQRLFGRPVVTSTEIAEGTGLTGAHDIRWICLYERRGIKLEITNSHEGEFITGTQRIRVDMRAALVTRRPAAFVKITGI